MHIALDWGVRPTQVARADMNCSMTTSVLPGRVRCHHPRVRFTRVKATDGCGGWGDPAPHVPTTQGLPPRCLPNVRRLAVRANPLTSTVGAGHSDPSWEAAYRGHSVSVGAGTARAARHADPSRAHQAAASSARRIPRQLGTERRQLRTRTPDGVGVTPGAHVSRALNGSAPAFSPA
jgi:hypothetical protein